MIEEQGIVRRYRDGEMVFKQGDKAKEVYVIRSGMVKIFHQAKEGEVVFANLRRNEFFGEMGFFCNQTRSASAKAIGDTELLIVDREILMDVIRESLIWSILERMSQRIREVDDKIEDLVVKDMRLKQSLKSIITRRRLERIISRGRLA